MYGGKLGRTTFVLLAAVALGGCVTSGGSGQPQVELSVPPGPALNEAGVAAGGYDLVHLVESEGEQVEGSGTYVTQIEGADCRFTSARNLATFKADPERYLPAYDGWCAWGVVAENEHRYNVPHLTVSRIFTVNDGQVLGFYNERVMEWFMEDPAFFTPLAEAGWEQLQENPRTWSDVKEDVRRGLAERS